MKHQNIHIITHSDAGVHLANTIITNGGEATLHRSPKDFKNIWNSADAILFIGALGICVRTIASLLENKKSDPAVINIDANGQFVQPVLSGHVGGANQLSQEIASLLGAQSVLTTVSDTSDLWALDLLPKTYGWQLETDAHLTTLMADFVNGNPVALLLEARDCGTLFLETTLPEHVTLVTDIHAIDARTYSFVIAVSPFIHQLDVPVLYYRPAMLSIGLGAQKNIPVDQFIVEVEDLLQKNGLSPKSIASIASVDAKSEEYAFQKLAENHNVEFNCYTAHELDMQDVPNPSDRPKEAVGTRSVAEAAATLNAKNDLLLPKKKAKVGEQHFTCAVAIHNELQRCGHIEIVGAGPGDPELVSVRGKRFLQSADLILYAGSLVPKELTYYAKQGCVVKSSAGMDLQTQIETMKPFYDRGLLVVRLHTGDPCIYGAIQEQMAKMDKLGMNYHITPGISSFQAAAAALESQFTIPEEVQSIILTRGEGRTPMPEKEQLHKLAASQSTMCIYLSASIAEKVQTELLVHYPKETPVAICYKLTWKDEKIWRTTLENLARTVSENNLSMTTMIVVGKAIGNREGESKLYHQQFTHAFREGKDA